MPNKKVVFDFKETKLRKPIKNFFTFYFSLMLVYVLCSTVPLKSFAGRVMKYLILFFFAIIIL
jgi:hypothetical protein